MAKSLLPPPPPFIIGAILLTISPAFSSQPFTPTAKLTLPSFTFASTAITLSAPFFSSSILLFISPPNSLITTFAPFISKLSKLLLELAFFSSSLAAFSSAFSFLIALSKSAFFSSISHSPSSCLSSFVYCVAECAQMASMRLTPALTPLSFVMKNEPISFIFSTCVPPQNSLLSPSVSTRTISPYFSPKSAIAPEFLALLMSIISVFAFAPFWICAFTQLSICSNSWLVTGFGCEKSKRKRFGSTLDPA